LNSTERWFTYDDITLRLYLEIAEGGDYKKLIKKGKYSSDECYAKWEDIIKQNGKHTNDFSYINYFQTVQQYANLIAEYNLVKALLFKVLITDYKNVIEDVAMLVSKGYNIDKSSQEKYNESIENAFKKSNNLVTKILAKQNELNQYAGNKETKATIGSMVANLNTAIGFKAADYSILLSEYNEYRKIINKKNGLGNNKAGNNQ
jgi:hypothetical protein